MNWTYSIDNKIRELTELLHWVWTLTFCRMNTKRYDCTYIWWITGTLWQTLGSSGHVFLWFYLILSSLVEQFVKKDSSQKIKDYDLYFLSTYIFWHAKYLNTIAWCESSFKSAQSHEFDMYSLEWMHIIFKKNCE